MEVSETQSFPGMAEFSSEGREDDGISLYIIVIAFIMFYSN